MPTTIDFMGLYDIKSVWTSLGFQNTRGRSDLNNTHHVIGIIYKAGQYLPYFFCQNFHVCKSPFFFNELNVLTHTSFVENKVNHLLENYPGFYNIVLAFIIQCSDLTPDNHCVITFGLM